MMEGLGGDGMGEKMTSEGGEMVMDGGWMWGR